MLFIFSSYKYSLLLIYEHDYIILQEISINARVIENKSKYNNKKKILIINAEHCIYGSVVKNVKSNI